MNDITVQFSVLWGMAIGSAFKPSEIEMAKKMKNYDSQELLKLLSGWADDFLKSNFEDTVDYFTDRLARIL